MLVYDNHRSTTDILSNLNEITLNISKVSDENSVGSSNAPRS